MPAEPPPSLESLARAVWIAWGRLGPPQHGVEWSALCRAMADLGDRLASPEPPPIRALDYMLPIRLQCELRLACALITHGYPTDDREAQAVIDRARILARLLLDGPDAR